MIDIVVVLIIILGVILTLLAIEKDEYVLWLLATIVWMVAALGCLEIEIPYQMFNASSGVIETGVHTFSVHGVVYLFVGMGILTLIEFSTCILSILGDKKKWR
jgi:hypothetical protein